MRLRLLRLGIVAVAGTGILGYLTHRMVRYQRMESDRKIEEVIVAKAGKGLEAVEELPVREEPAVEPLIVEKDPLEPGVPELTEGSGNDGNEVEEKPEVRIIPPGRVAGDLPDRAVQAAALVLPELKPDLQVLGLRAGDPVFIRVFKAERELELWIFHQGQDRSRLFKTYRVAGMSGRLGPKLAEGDYQAPEGFYHVGRGRMNPNSNFHLSFDLGFPNAYDRAQGRTGSYLMVHGNTISAGCFAMTDYGIEEIYTLADAALTGGSRYFRVHVFPFRMTESAMADAKGHQWIDFWENLRDGYLHFERTGTPPDVSVVNGRYAFADGEDSR